jgi:rRNA maturation endonuclease Nob1
MMSDTIPRTMTYNTEGVLFVLLFFGGFGLGGFALFIWYVSSEAEQQPIRAARAKEQERSRKIARLKNLETADRYDDAARGYEELGMFKEAGELRRKNRTIAVVATTKNINADLNALLRQIKTEGIVAVYRCPHCGGNIRIGKGGNLSDVQICQYCGSTLEAMALADFLKSILS